MSTLPKPKPYPMTIPMVEKYGQPIQLAGLGATHPTVSGFSSGGYMTTQLLVAYSDFFEGAGIAAGGPFACSTEYGPINCSTPKDVTIVNDRLLLMNAQKYEYENRIAPLKNLKNIPVWIFSGVDDTTVLHSIVDKTYNFFKSMGVRDLTYVNDMKTTHSFPTTDPYAPKACNQNNFQNCGLDGVKAIFEHTLPGGLDKPRVDHWDYTKWGSLQLFDQTKFFSGTNTSMDDNGMIYIPNTCNSKKCRVHVSLHGCSMGMNSTVGLPVPYHYGDMYVLFSSYLQYAASNDIIIIAPQVVNTPINPGGCWDLGGYTGPEYFGKNGVQTQAVKAMVDKLMEAPSGNVTFVN